MLCALALSRDLPASWVAAASVHPAHAPHRRRRHCLPRRLQVALGTTEVLSFTKVKPSKRSDKALKYGPYKDVPPFTSTPITGAQASPAAAAAAVGLLLRPDAWVASDKLPLLPQLLRRSTCQPEQLAPESLSLPTVCVPGAPASVPPQHSPACMPACARPPAHRSNPSACSPL